MSITDAYLAFDDVPLRVFEDRVVIVPDDPRSEMLTGSGLVVPFGKAPTRGTVVAVGPGRRDANGALIPMVLEPGMRVEFPKVGGTDVNVDGVDFHLIPESLVLAIVTSD